MRNYLTGAELKNLKVGEQIKNSNYMWVQTVVGNDGKILKLQTKETEQNYEGKVKNIMISFFKDNAKTVYYKEV